MPIDPRWKRFLLPLSFVFFTSSTNVLRAQPELRVKPPKKLATPVLVMSADFKGRSNGLRFSDDGKRIWNRLAAWSVPEGKKEAELAGERGTGVVDVATLGKRTLLALRSSKKTVIWDQDTQQPQRELTQKGRVRALPLRREWRAVCRLVLATADCLLW